MINAQVEETMLLLAEAYTVNNEAKNALDVYQEILDGGQGGSNTKDIYRKMAPLYTQLESFDEAAECLKNVIKQEQSEILKVGLLTKIAGNYKKANNKGKCIEASTDAYDLMKTLSSE